MTPFVALPSSSLMASSCKKSFNQTNGCESPFSENDVYKVIRKIVPPPPLLVSKSHSTTIKCPTTEIPFLDSSSEQLFTRRPCEKTSLLKCINQLFSAPETQRNLQELLVEILQERKYSQESDVMHLVFCAMQKWPNDIFIQRNALACLVCLSSHNAEFCLPLIWIHNLIKIMKTSEFSLDESILRSGVKLIQNMKILEKFQDKFEIVCILLNALCNIPGVDDLMSFTQTLVKFLQPFEKRKIRNDKDYIKMLLEFPYRLNCRITVPLCWSALDILLTLAECDQEWEMLFKVGGAEKLKKLSQRPEMKDRCDAILHLAASEDVICLTSSTSVNLRGESFASRCVVKRVCKSPHPQVLKPPPQAQSKQCSTKISPIHNFIHTRSSNASVQTTVQTDINVRAHGKTHSALYAWVLPSGETRNSHKSIHKSLQEPVPQESIDLSKEDTQLLPMDTLLTRNAPTPPPTLGDVPDEVDLEFSDDDQHSDVSSRRQTHLYAPLLSTPLPLSPSCSPPLSASFKKETISKGQSTNMNKDCLTLGLNDPHEESNLLSSTYRSGSKHTRVGNSFEEELPSREKRKVRKQKCPRSKNNLHNNKHWYCIFCKQPKGKQVILVKQLRQLHPYLLQLGSVDLLLCLNSLLCKCHKLKKNICSS